MKKSVSRRSVLAAGAAGMVLTNGVGRAFAQAAGITLHVECLYGDNSHHIVEACFKALARALRQAVTLDQRAAQLIPSTKGTLGGEIEV